MAERYKRSSAFRASLDHQLKTAPSLNRYMFLQARFWLFPRCVEHLTAKGKAPAMDPSTFGRLLQVFRQCYGLSTTADLMLAAIKQATNTEVVLMAMDTVTREADCWTANDRWSRIVDVLMERLHGLEVGDLHRRIVGLLTELEMKGRLSKVEKKELKAASQKIQEVSL
jgi:mediator of RNA polymerase II transcription subunit 12